MQTIYLRDGRMADLVTKTEKGYLVDPYVTFTIYEGEEDSAPSGSIELVQEIFEAAPVEIIEAECQKIFDRMSVISAEKDSLTTEVSKLTREVTSLQKIKTDLGRLILNKSELKNATRIILFEKDKIAPFVMDPKTTYAKKINLSYSITQWETGERCWAYEMNWGDSWSNGNYFDEKYGLVFDLTDEEILALTLKRQSEKGVDAFTNYMISATKDEWLTDEFKLKKEQIKQSEKLNRIEKLKDDIKRAKEDLEKAENALTVS